MNKLLMTAGAAALIAATLHADTHDIASGTTETLNGVTLYKTTGGDLYVGGGNTGWDTVKSYVHEGGFHLVADA